MGQVAEKIHLDDGEIGVFVEIISLELHFFVAWPGDNNLYLTSGWSDIKPDIATLNSPYEAKDCDMESSNKENIIFFKLKKVK